MGDPGSVQQERQEHHNQQKETRELQEKMTGYASLLNIEAQPHWTIFLTDYALEPVELRRINRQLNAVDTRLLFLRIDRGVANALQQMRAASVDLRKDYVSLQTIVLRNGNLKFVKQLFDRFARGDLARVDTTEV